MTSPPPEEVPAEGLQEMERLFDDYARALERAGVLVFFAGYLVAAGITFSMLVSRRRKRAPERPAMP